ncbi:MAG TPA: hypothetical protein DDY13_05390 [Cytophagales bacterium]|jgi:putative membrane protein|nr:hypothetical protein [Cytophagales bacterium]
MKLLIRLVLYALAVLITAHLLPGVSVESFLIAVIVAGVLTLLNVLLKPLLVILTIPITVVTLGLFLLVINALIIMLTDWLIGGFDVTNFWWALLFSLILSLINGIFMKLSGEEKQ